MVPLGTARALGADAHASEHSVSSRHVGRNRLHDEKAVRNMLVLFRPLDGNVRAEVEHHNTRYTKDLCQRYQDNFTASGPDEIARAVTKVMGEEDSKWREAVHAQTQLSKTNVEARVD